MPENQFEQEFDLKAYLQIVARRKWMVLSFAGALTALVAIGTALQPKVYIAKSSVLAGRETPRLINFDPLPQERIRDRDYLRTQAAILTSQSHLQKVIRRLMKDGFYGTPRQTVDEKRVETLALGLQKRVKVTTVEDNQVIQITVEGAVPDRVARIANAVADEYVQSGVDQKTAMAGQAAAWLRSQMQEAKTELDQAQTQLRDFKEKENITGPDENDPLSAMSIVKLNDDYVTARIQRIGVEHRIEALKRARSSTKGGAAATTQSIDAEVNRQMRETLTKEYLDTQLQLKDLSQKYSPEHPDIITLKGKAERLQSELKGLDGPVEVPGVDPSIVPTGNLADLQGEYTQLLSREQALAQALSAHRVQSQNQSRTAVSYTLLKQNVDLKKQTYADLQSKLNDATLSGELKAPTIQVLDRALVPKAPAEPQPIRNLLIAVPLGLVLGIGLAFLMETLDKRVKSPQDVAQHLKLSLLTVIPGIGLHEGVGREEGKAKLVTIQQPRSHAAECYRNLRTSILFSSGGPVPRIILVTSAVAGEGKSTTAANLAVVMAQSGRKVLLIDADLRRPALQRYFARRENRGLIRLLKDEIRPEDAVQASEIENLDLLLCHGIPQNPSELLGSDRMRSLIETLRARYDSVIIDSPVVISVPDAIILATRAEAVLLVHCPTAADRDMVKYAKQKLDEVKANLLGLVMNKVDVKSSQYYYHNYLYYGYGSEPTEQAAGNEKEKRKQRKS
jgi:succinoglycan biosynthesis transport protein ExoP